MSVPSVPPPIAQLGVRPFSFYPAILNIQHNEWIYRSATWSDVLIRNTKTCEEISVPRRYLGEISRVDAPVMIVGLLKELEFREQAVLPAQRRVIEMPRAVNESPRPRITAERDSPAPVVGIRIEDGHKSRIGKLVIGGVALGVVGCVLAVTFSRGGVLASRALYSSAMQSRLPFTAADDRETVAHLLGAPSAERSISHTDGLRYHLLVYPQLGLYVILRAPAGSSPHYIGSMDSTWRPVHAVPGAGLESLPRF